MMGRASFRRADFAASPDSKPPENGHGPIGYPRLMGMPLFAKAVLWAWFGAEIGKRADRTIHPKWRKPLSRSLIRAFLMERGSPEGRFLPRKLPLTCPFASHNTHYAII